MSLVYLFIYFLEVCGFVERWTLAAKSVNVCKTLRSGEYEDRERKTIIWILRKKN